MARKLALVPTSPLRRARATCRLAGHAHDQPVIRSWNESHAPMEVA